MKRETALVLVVAAALLVTAFQTVQLVGLTDAVKTTGLAAVQSAGSGYDQTSQNVRPGQVQTSAVSGQGQIGGC